MPHLNIAVPHSLPQGEAVQRIKHLLDEVRTQFADRITNLHENWDGNMGTFSFSAMGVHVSGTLTVMASQVEIAGKLPLAAMLFKRKIESTIRHRAEALLA